MVFTPPILGAEKEKRAGARGGGRKRQLLAFLEGSAEWMRPGSLGISELEKALLGGGYPLPRLPQAWKQPLSRVERQREPEGADPGQSVSGTQPQRRGRGVSAFKGEERVRGSFTRTKGKGKDACHFSIFPEPPRFTETAPEPQKMPR